MLTRRRLLRTLPFAALAPAGCEKPLPPPRYHLPRRPLEIVTTTVQGADLLRRIGGEAVTVRSLIPPETNPHLWVPTATEIGTTRLADAFFLSGLGLEANFKENLDTLRKEGLHVGVLANGLDDADILLRPDGSRDPHFWLDPRLWAKAATEAADVLTTVAPSSATWFMDRSHEVLTELAYLHDVTSRQLSEVPPRNRFLLTSHDTMSYFGRAYQLDVRSIGSSTGEVPEQMSGDLNGWIRDHRVRTLFREYFADVTAIKELARPLMLISDPSIFSLSLALPGTRVAGITDEHEVEFFMPAFRYTVENIQGRLRLE